MQITVHRTGHKGAGNRCLLQDVARVVRWESVKHAAHLAGQINHTSKVRTGDFFTIALPEHRTFNPLINKVFFHLGLIFEIDFRFSARHLIERWLRDIEVPVLNQLRHLPIEERQQQRSNMCAIHVRIRHDDDLVVAQFFEVELVPANACAQRHDKVTNLLASKHPVKPRPFYVQNLTLQRQNRLCFTVATCLRRPTSRVTLDEKDFGL